MVTKSKVLGKSFHAKVLLFGEYSVIQGGKALVIPFSKFSGALELPENLPVHESGSAKSNLFIQQFLEYLIVHKNHSSVLFPLDTDRLAADVANGLFFRSDIPLGYGLGSSGALVAAIASEYGQDIPFAKQRGGSISAEKALKLKTQLAFMESFFHGSSSGLDPMGSLLGRPFIYSPENGFTFPSLPIFEPAMQKQIFLIDTGRTRDTLSLVAWFNEQVKNRNINAELLKSINEVIITAIREKKPGLFDDFLAQLSVFQLEVMKPMIPLHLHELWEEGIQHRQYTLKLCGSGGGGYMLGFTSHWKEVEEVFLQKGFKAIPVTV